MNHLRELLEQFQSTVKYTLSIDGDVAIDLHREVQKLAPQAVSFFMGDVGQLGGILGVEELSRLPYNTCWFEVTANDGAPPSLTIGGLVTTKADGAIRLYVYVRTAHEWRLHGVADMQDLWANQVHVIPNDTLVATGVQHFRELVAAFLTAMNCKNVQRERTDPSPKLQKARAKRGKAPLFSYWTLALDGKRETGTHGGGTHAGPRLHLRRGHPRQYSPGHYTWVQPCVVGNKKAGMVHKDYRATPEMYSAAEKAV